jgi:hypothetical protein
MIAANAAAAAAAAAHCFVCCYLPLVVVGRLHSFPSPRPGLVAPPPALRQHFAHVVSHCYFLVTYF